MIFKKSLLKFISATIFAASLSTPAFADTLDFSEVTSGYTGTSTLNLSNATFYTDAPEFYIGFSGLYGESNGLGAICAVDGFVDCGFDMELEFTDMVENLSFASFVTSYGDEAEISAYKGNDYLGSILVNSVMDIDFSSFGMISSLFFDDITFSSYSNGIVYGDFNFETVSAVPLPASLPLFGAALVGLIFLKKKRDSVEV
ncbi:MAG: PEP-CTERM sorting domain-containing protein [Sneathiella sp.]|nr:PEP-CTERM sorting domain-containing protein [Sneathiella sp.]